MVYNHIMYLVGMYIIYLILNTCVLLIIKGRKESYYENLIKDIFVVHIICI